ncbi:hypothetical protein ASPZODRAFT_17004 [Penicilliopsis zonata CBS 506.65]|uniref:Uncharacterized protein n=1 Tax=Penicilliopsis zonata CBS 506.65 TaxID=1073090 RepID=A0A1L9SEV6_9EURO|nr:hypothetical protein ASPZODRAFT_17004 [Penicilliopsis zonata CBS 506.65]OJJ45554.1 hypothetical protein ASPZODRAFT_17004 [Penicilliopsis zonata CBS 506.65]
MSIHAHIRRGAEYVADYSSKNPEQRPDSQVDGWLMGLLFVTSVALVIIYWAVHYTYDIVVSTLAAIEDSSPDVYIRIDADDDSPMTPVRDVEQVAEAAAAAQPQPITSKMRTTVRHLRARAGPWSRFRGLSIGLFYTILKMAFFAIIPFDTGLFKLEYILVDVLGEALLANLSMAWVHIIISEPSPKRWYQRIPGWRSWLRIAPVAALKSAATSVAFYGPLALGRLITLIDPFEKKPNLSSVKECAIITSLVLIPTIVSFLVSVPARAIFIRVAASMLPEEDETIVPFDRSFRNTVVPAILGGSGKVSIKNAWKTFDWPARIRFTKIVLKVLAIEMAIAVGFVLAVAGQMALVGQETITKLAAVLGNNPA